MATYRFDIQSIHEANPGLPPTLGNLDVNRRICAGDPIDPEHRRHAWAVFNVLKAMHSEFCIWL